MNEHFVTIKVDREERPDVDAVYMEATQAHDRPRRLADDGVPHPGRRAVLLRHLLPAARRGTACRRSRSCSTASRRPGRATATRSTTAGQRIAARLAERARRRLPAQRPPTRERPRRGRPRARRRVRRRRTAASAAPEVPAVDGAGVPAAPPRPHRLDATRSTWSAGTCEAMARGGMYDQLAGGFARYSRRRALGGAALREDVVRQRAAAPRLRCTGGGRPGRRSPRAWSPRDRAS